AIRVWMMDQGIPERKLRVIHNGVDTKKFSNSANGLSFKNELSIPEGAPVITMLSRLDANKGAEYFLRAAQKILKRFPDVHFVVVGDVFEFEKRADAKLDTIQREKLIQRAKNLSIDNRVHFIGER